MSAKAFEQLAADAVVDALEWKTRARNAEDNARELLALVQEIVAAMQASDLHEYGTSGDWYTDARAAIAKATGGAA